MFRVALRFDFFFKWAMLVFAVNVSAQPKFDNFKTIPAKPLPAQSIRIEFQPSQSDLIVESRLKAVAYINKIGTEDPRAIEIEFSKNEYWWHGSLATEEDDVSFLMVFYDSAGNIDNYKGIGYWVPLYDPNENMLPGSQATIAYMYCGAWPSTTYDIDSDRDMANQLYKKDFQNHPSLKRIYHRYYIASIRFENAKDHYKRELDYYSEYPDLNEWELLDISKKYFAINDSASGKKYEKMIFEKYSTGCWATQVSSLDYQKKIIPTNDVKTNQTLYADFKKRYSNIVEECSKRYINTIETILLRRLIEQYIKSGMYEEWKREADKLESKWKFSAYALAAQTLTEKKIYPEISEQLASDASEWLSVNLGAPRIVTDRLFSTNSEVRNYREEQLGECLGTYGYSLLLQKKNEEAVPLLKKAVLFTKMNKPKINQYYIESLVAINSITEAIYEIGEMEKLGKVNPQTMEIYRKLLSQNKKSSPQVSAGKNKQNKLKLISEKCPSFEVTDSQGTSVNVKDYVGKVVVIDFWATWCGPCIAGFESMNRIIERYNKNSNVVFLFINTQESGTDRIKKAKELIQNAGYNFTVLFDELNKAGSTFNFSALPTKLVIDKEGSIRYRESSSEKEDELIAVIDALNR
jgi:thiol-disulfide isomerase/thioredoxin